jgi:hypothetical protein
MKRGVVQSPNYRATVICQKQQLRSDEIVTLMHDLQLSAYHIGFINLLKPTRCLIHQQVQHSQIMLSVCNVFTYIY